MTAMLTLWVWLIPLGLILGNTIRLASLKAQPLWLLNRCGDRFWKLWTWGSVIDTSWLRNLYTWLLCSAARVLTGRFLCNPNRVTDPCVWAIRGPRLATAVRLCMVLLTSPSLWVVLFIFTPMMIPMMLGIRTMPLSLSRLPSALWTLLRQCRPRCGRALVARARAT